MREQGFKIDAPQNISTSNHTSYDWVVKICVLSSIALSIGGTLDSKSVHENGTLQEICGSICGCGNVVISEDLLAELNHNATVKERLTSRLKEFSSELKYGWNGGAELPMEDMSVSNALAAIDATASEDLARWTVFPSSNGTILFSPTDDFVAGISIGNSEFSYAAIGNNGQEIKGKDKFSVKSFKLAIGLINSLGEA